VKRRWLIALALLVVVVAAAVGVQVWRTSSSAAESKSRCLANQRTIEGAAYDYEAIAGTEALARLDGPVSEGSPLTVASGKGDPLLATPVPRCPSRAGEYYILKNGRTDCPVHGTYQ
jgi:hypothetical protein